MRLTIVRHAIAVSRDTGSFPNDDRPLTQAGIEKMTFAARGLARILDRPDRICTSPLLRARDTARIVSASFSSPVRIDESETLLPGSPPTALLGLLAGQRMEHVMLVGHEPGLTTLIGHLLSADPGSSILKKGGAAHLEIDPTGAHVNGRLLWLLKPKHLRMLGKENDV